METLPPWYYFFVIAIWIYGGKVVWEAFKWCDQADKHGEAIQHLHHQERKEFSDLCRLCKADKA